MFICSSIVRSQEGFFLEACQILNQNRGSPPPLIKGWIHNSLFFLSGSRYNDSDE
jgi:hypothetical protein